MVKKEKSNVISTNKRADAPLFGVASAALYAFLYLIGIVLGCRVCLCFDGGAFCEHLLFLSKNALEREVDRHAQNDHAERPELRGRKPRNERAAIVAAEHFVKEAEHTVGNEIEAHVVLKALFEEQIGADPKENKEERRLIELGGVHLVQKAGELHAEEGVGHSAVAAGGAKASNSAKGVRDGDDTGGEREDVGHPCGKTGAENEVDDEEECRAANQSADKGHARIHADVKAVLGVFEEVIKGLKQDRGANARRNGRDTVKEQKIDEFFIKAELFAVEREDHKARENAEREHDTVHMDIEKDGIWKHTITSKRIFNASRRVSL